MLDLEVQEEEVKILLYSLLLISNNGKQAKVFIQSQVVHHIYS